MRTSNMNVDILTGTVFEFLQEMSLLAMTIFETFCYFRYHDVSIALTTSNITFWQ